MSKTAFLILLGIVGLAAFFGGFLIGENKARLAQKIQNSPTPNPSVTVLPTPTPSNPLGNVKTNPFEDVKFNPFE